MMFPIKRTARKRIARKPTIDDLPVEVLLLIFKCCDPVMCYRARMVCSRWRTVIDEIDEESRKAILGPGHARLYVCDRRRVVLEKFLTMPSCSSSFEEMTNLRRSDFYTDCSATISADNWSYCFDSTQWSRNYDIVEVWLQNFGSFLERDKTNATNLTSSNSENANSAGSIVKDSASVQTMSSVCSICHDHSSSCGHSSSNSSGALSLSGIVPYNLLPSCQKHYAKSDDIVINKSTEEVFKQLTELSSGRFEKLAVQLNEIKPLHIVYNDLSPYQKRPTMLLFWFLKKLPNLRKLTLDSIQSDQVVELHKVFSVVGIDELNIMQPAEKVCIIVSLGLLEAFLNIERSKRRRFRIKITGKTSLNANAICSFIKKWQNHRDIIEFHSIMLDATCVNPNDFMHATGCKGCRVCNNEYGIKKEIVAKIKPLIFRHRRYNVWINYKYESGYLIFTYYNPKDKRHWTVEKTVERPRRNVVTFYSPLHSDSDEVNDDDDGDDHRNGNHNSVNYTGRSSTKCTTNKGFCKSYDDDTTVLQRLISLITRSNG